MNGYKTPEIHIKDAWLLRLNASQHLHELWAKKGDKLADDEWMAKKVEEYTAAWKPYETKILEGMCELYGLKFRENIISVYIAPWFNAFSSPLVIGVKYEPDQFIDMLAHELLHRLFTCNDKYDIDFDDNLILGKEWERLLGKGLPLNVKVHIPVHAGLKALYLDVLQEPKRLTRDISYSKEGKWGKPYVEAWEYVEKHGYKEINEKLRSSYKKLTPNY
jgi:hypothetical protein